MSNNSIATSSVEGVAQVAKEAGLAPEIQMIIVLVGILFVLAWPLMLLVRTWQANKASARKEAAVTDGDVATYARMKQQIDEATAAIKGLVEEKNRWFSEATTLRAEVHSLKACANTLETMKLRLGEKDKTIAKKDAELSSMVARVLDMQGRIHALELRLARDERMFCNKAEGCSHKPTVVEVPLTLTQDFTG